MKTLILTIGLFVSSTFFLVAQTKKLMILGFRDSIYSKILGEKREILVHLPDTPADEFAPDQKYPVIYVLDAGSYFQTIAAISESKGGGSGNFSSPKVIVVGIVNTDRMRDLSPTHWPNPPLVPAGMAASSGDGEKFLGFIEKELIPHIDSICPAAPHRTIIGHSLGGLAAINALLNHKGLFQNHVVLDPTTWWEKENWINSVKNKLTLADYSNTSVFLAIAHSVDKSLSIEALKTDTNLRTLPMRSELNFDQYIKSIIGAHPLIYQSKYYPDYDHGGVALPGIIDAMGFIYNFYGISFPFPGFFAPDYSEDGKLAAHYEMVSKRLGYKVAPPGELVNAVAHELMGSKQFDRAKKYLDLNLKNYPNSYKSYEAMGDYYKELGKRELSDGFYKKAGVMKGKG